MKRALILALVCIVAITFATSCKPKVNSTPPAPQAKEQPKAEPVKAPVVKPAPTEEEIFMAKSLDQLNKEKPLALINFDYDKFNVREDAKSILESNAAWLKKWKSAKILVEGHCDERGTEDYNLALGENGPKPLMSTSSVWAFRPSG